MPVTVQPGDRLVDNRTPGRRGVVQAVRGRKATVRWVRGNETTINTEEISAEPKATGYTLITMGGTE